MPLIQDLSETLHAGWSVKDSFSTLDLAPLGFHVLFEAVWFWREPSGPPVNREAAKFGCRSVHDARRLASWERAWNANSDVSLTPQPPVFHPSLLTDPEIVFIEAFEEGERLGGAIVNRASDVVGLSNVFAPPGEDLAAFWVACAAKAAQHFPGLPIVTYAHGAELEIAREAGFEPLEALRVWKRDSTLPGQRVSPAG